MEKKRLTFDEAYAKYYGNGDQSTVPQKTKLTFDEAYEKYFGNDSSNIQETNVALSGDMSDTATITPRTMAEPAQGGGEPGVMRQIFNSAVNTPGLLMGNAAQAIVRTMTGVPAMLADYLPDSSRGGVTGVPEGVGRAARRAAAGDVSPLPEPVNLPLEYYKGLSGIYERMTPQPANFYDEVVGGIGSMGGYMAGGALLGGPAGVFASGVGAVAPKLAKTVTGFGGGFIEGSGESADVYFKNRDRGVGKDEAMGNALKTLAINIVLDPVTNYLGFVAENKYTKGAFKRVLNASGFTKRFGDAAAEIIASSLSQGGSGAFTEFAQETTQGLTSQRYGDGRSWGDVLSAENIKNTMRGEGLVGGVVGGITGGAFGASGASVHADASAADIFMDGVLNDIENGAPQAPQADAGAAQMSAEDMDIPPRKSVPNTAILNEMRNFYKEIRSVPEAQRSAEDRDSFAALRNILELYSSGREQEAEALAKERFETGSLERAPDAAPMEMKERATAELAIPVERQASPDESMALLNVIRDRFVDDFRRYGDVDMDTLSGDERYHAALVRAAGDAYQQGDFQRTVNILAHLYGPVAAGAEEAPIAARERATSELAVPGWRMEEIEPPKAPAPAGPRYVEIPFPQRRRGEVAAEMAKMTKDAIGRKYGMDAAEMAAKRGTMAAADAVVRQASQNGRTAAGSETTPPLNAIQDAQSPAIQKQGQVDGDKAAATDENYQVGYTYQDRGWGYDKDGLRFDDGIVTKKVTSVKDGQFYVEQDGVGGADIFDAERMKDEVEASAPARVKAFHADRMSAAQAVEQKDAEGLAKRERERVNGFTDGMSDMRRGQVNKALNKQFRYDGRAMSRREYVEDAAAKDGAHVYKGGRNGDYRLYEQDGERGTFAQITKTEYDYSNHLRGKGTKSEVAAELEAARKEVPAEMPSAPVVSGPVANENMQEGPSIPDAKAVASESVEGVAYPGGEYKYYLNARPAGPGAVPKGITRIDNEDKGGRHGAVYYDHELSAKDVSDYELVPAKDGGDNQKKDEPVNNEMGPDENVKPEAEEAKPAELSVFAVAKKSPARHISEKQRTAAGKSVQAAAKKASDMQGYYTDEAGRQVFTDTRAVFRLSKQVEGLEAAGANASWSTKVASLFEHVKKEESVTLGREEIAEIVARGKRPRGKKAAEVPEFITKVGQAYVDSTRLGEVLSVLGADEVTVYTSKPRADESGRGYYYSNVYFTSENGEALLAPVNLRDAGARAVDAYYKGVSTPVHEKTKANESQKKGNGGVSQEQPSVGKPAEKISDFGEKIGGARKDLAALYIQKMEAKYSDEDVANRPLSEVFPAPDYEKMLESGADKRLMSLVRAIRDAVPAKPRSSFKMLAYVRAVKSAREVTSMVMSDPDFASKTMERMGKVSTAQRGIFDKAALYEEVGHETSLKDYSVTRDMYSMLNGKKLEKPTQIWTIRKNGRAVAYGESLPEAAVAFRAYIAENGGKSQDRKPDYAVYIQRSFGKDGYYVGKKVGRDYAELAGPFMKPSEADTYMNEHTVELARKLEKFKATPAERRDVNSPRIGADMRGGRDVTPEMFSSAFGFRGVEFGNWVEQGKRQADLNEAYDSLMDLAAIIGVPSKALSLNGRLGLAFGARGKGGKNSAKAHYEPDSAAINLTKAHGAGSLAHEWMHAVDDYFAKAGGKKDMISGSSEVYAASKGREPKDIPGVRSEIIKAFGEVRRAIAGSEMPKRAAELDKRRSKPYWTTDTELQSRAFEAYIADKLAAGGASNDYLANIVSEEYWQEQNALLDKDGTKSFPYPTEDEMPVIRMAFDNFFKTVKTRETDKGMEMYRLAPAARARLDADAAAFAKQVDDFVAGKMGRYEEFKVMRTPLVLQISDAMVKPLQMVMSQNTLKKIFTKHKLSPNLVKQIPAALADPIMVLRSDTRPADSLVVMLALRDSAGRTLNVPIVLNVSHGSNASQLVFNDISSIYGRGDINTGAPRDIWFIAQANKPGQLLYIDKNKASKWAHDAGLDVPGRKLIKGLNSSVKTEADLVKAQSAAPGSYALGEKRAGLPPLSVSDVAARVKGAMVSGIDDGKMKLEFSNGTVWIVDTQAEAIAADPEIAARDYGRELRSGESVVGRTRVIDGQRFIDLVAGMSDAKTFSHEVFESAWDSLTTEEQDAVLKTHGSRENAAERYGEFLEGRIGKLTKRTQAIFQRVKDFFSAIRASLFGKNSEDIFREVATGKMWRREAGAREDSEHYRLGVRRNADADGDSRSEVQKAEMTDVDEKTGEVTRNIHRPEAQFSAAEQQRELSGNEQWQKDLAGTGLESVVSTRSRKKPLWERMKPHEGWWDDFSTDWRDDLHPLLKHFGEKFHMKATNELHGAYSRSLYRIQYGVEEKGVKALQGILKMIPDGEHNGFATYAVLKHLRDVAKMSEAARSRIGELDVQRKRKDITKAERKKIENEKESLKKQVKETKGDFAGYDAAVKKVEAHYPHWAAAQAELVKYNKALLEMMSEEGIISRELFDELNARYPNYVPLQRDFGDEKTLDAFVAGRGVVNVSAPIKRLRGSQRDVIDPFEQILRNSFQFETAAARQRLAKELVKGYDEGLYKDVFEEQFSAGDLKELAQKAFAKAGSANDAKEKAALQEEGRKLMARSKYAQPLSAHSPTESVFYVYENGKKRHFKADNDIYQALTLSGNQFAENNIIKRLATFPAKTLRAGTTHGLTFAIRNMFRDTVSYAVLGEDFRPFVDTAIGMTEAITGNKELYEDFMKHGGLQGMTNVSADKMADLLHELKRDKKNLLLDAVKLNGDNTVWKLLGDISELSETASRLGQYKRLIEAKNADGSVKYTKDEAVYMTRDNMNFMRAGRLGRRLNQYIAFFNASIQGVDKMFRTFYKDGRVNKKALLRAGLYITLPSMLQHFYNYSDDERKKKYQNLPAWRKNLFWNFIVGDTAVTIPKPFELGVIFGSLPERMVDTWFANDEAAFEGFTGALFSAMTPEMAPNLMNLMFELGSGYSKFYDRQIVPQRERRLEREYQYGPYTSEMAKGVAKVTKYLPDFNGVPLLEKTMDVVKSPRRLEYAYSQMTGGAGKEFSNLVDRGVRALRGETRPSKPWWQTMPGFRGLFADASVGGRDQELFQKELQDEKHGLLTKLNSAVEKLKTEGPASLSKAQIRLLEAEQAIKYTAKLNTDKNGIYAAYREIRAITLDKQMTADEKAAEIKKLELYIRDASQQGLAEVRDIYRFLKEE